MPHTLLPRRIIDSHQHFWSVNRKDYGWLTPDSGVLYQDYHPTNLAPHLDKHRVVGTVVVQAAETADETNYLLDLADHTKSIMGVVGWVDLLSIKAPATIERLALHPKFKAVRPMLQDLSDDDWIIDPALEPAITALINHNVRFDALVKPRHLPALKRFAEHYPALKIVIDHAAKPRIASGELDPWRGHIAALAALPNVYCKLSGMVTEAKAHWQESHLAPYAHHVLDIFGAKRVMWGSDWPVLLVAGAYERWLAAASALTAHLSFTDRESIFYLTAIDFYGLTIEQG